MIVTQPYSDPRCVVHGSSRHRNRPSCCDLVGTWQQHGEALLTSLHVVNDLAQRTILQQMKCHRTSVLRYFKKCQTCSSLGNEKSRCTLNRRNGPEVGRVTDVSLLSSVLQQKWIKSCFPAFVKGTWPDTSFVWMRSLSAIFNSPLVRPGIIRI